MPKPGCTLITDASLFCAGVAGWAAWAKADGMACRSWDGQITQLWIATSSEAELAAIALGMRAAADYAPGHRLLLQSDSWRALALLRQELGFGHTAHENGISVGEGVKTPPSESEARLVGQVGQLRRAFGHVMVRHVKGHVRRANSLGRHRANADCDERAKAQMRVLRERFVAAQERASQAAQERQASTV